MAYANLGAALQAQGKRKEALAYFRVVAQREPHSPNAHYNLAYSLAEMGAWEEAIASYRHAIALNADFVEAHYNLGNLFLAMGKLDEAADAFQRAISLAPSHTDAFNNLGVVRQRQGRFLEALDCFRQAIQNQPENAEAHWNLAATLLLLGRWSEAWPEFEWRVYTRAFSPRHFSQPQWDGSHTADTVLVYAEQGFGDTIQFVRYLPMVKERVGRVIFECQPELATLLQHCEGIDELVKQPMDGQPPAFAFQSQVRLISLPGVFGTSLESVPRKIPYIHVPPSARERWQKRLAGREGYKVGIVWSGNPQNTNNPLRSCRLIEFAPLGDIGGLTWVSLQKGEAAQQVTSTSHGLRILPLGEELADFLDTAALILELDLVISVDTAVAHLAGALGRPVWTLLPFIPDWRWMLERADTPWYPTMRLFRQPAPGDWRSVFKQVAQELKQQLDRCGDKGCR
jgi:Flp pilus assembly protein TadD